MTLTSTPPFLTALFVSGAMALLLAAATHPVSTAPVPTPANTITQDAQGQPILLARMVVTATPLER